MQRYDPTPRHIFQIAEALKFYEIIEEWRWSSMPFKHLLIIVEDRARLSRDLWPELCAFFIEVALASILRNSPSPYNGDVLPPERQKTKILEIEVVLAAGA